MPDYDTKDFVKIKKNYTKIKMNRTEQYERKA